MWREKLAELLWSDCAWQNSPLGGATILSQAPLCADVFRGQHRWRQVLRSPVWFGDILCGQRHGKQQRRQQQSGQPPSVHTNPSQLYDVQQWGDLHYQHHTHHHRCQLTVSKLGCCTKCTLWMDGQTDRWGDLGSVCRSWEPSLDCGLGQ